MPFSIERNDLAEVQADVIVVTANEALQIDGGVGLAVALKAGLSQMQEFCDVIGGCPTGSAVVTPAFGLSAKYVVHVVGPVWQGGANGEEAILRRAYDSALTRAAEVGAESIALPLISARTFGVPVRLSFVIAIEAIKVFLQDYDADVRLVLYGEEAMAVGLSLYDDIAEYIDNNYVEERDVYFANSIAVSQNESWRERPNQARSYPRESMDYGAQRLPCAATDSVNAPAMPSLPKRKKRQGLVSRLADAIEDVRDRAAERKADRSHSGTCVVRNDVEQDQINGPFLEPQQLDDARESQARRGYCPTCGNYVGDRIFCPRCGRRVEGGKDRFADEDLRSCAASEDSAAFAPAPMAAPSVGASERMSGFEVPGGLDVASAPAPASEPAFEPAASPANAPAPFFESVTSSASASPMAMGAPQDTGAFAPVGLETWLDRLDAPFSTTLLALIDERGMTDAQVYKRANMSRQLFSKIRSDATYRPTKKTVLALSIALGLNLSETADLLKRAGFALSHSSKFDVIVEYFIVNENYDMFDINEALYAFDQPLF